MKTAFGLATASVLLCGVVLHSVVLLGEPGQLPIGTLPGQRPPRPGTMTAPPESEIPTPQPTFRTSVEFVEVTVVASDKNGQFAGDLTRDDFQVFDEGVKQTISAFAKIDIPLPTQPASGAGTATARGPAMPPEDVASSSLHPDTRLFVLVLDDLHVAAERTQRVRTTARQFVERFTSPTDLVAVVLPSGRKDMLLGFTRDRARVLAVIDQFQGQKLRSATYERDVDKRYGGGSALREGRDPSDGERAYRAHVSMATIADVSSLLAASQGRRKSLLYFSEGIDYNVADVMGTVQRYASEVTQTIANALSAATRTNVSLYAIDPRGLAAADSDAVELPIYAERTLTALSEPGRTGEQATSIRSLRDLAEPTGGFAATDMNDVDTAFARILRENSTYYVLGFQPSKPAAGGSFRKLDVRVAKPGITLTTRKGYLVPRKGPAATSTTTPTSTTTAAVPNLSPELAPLLASALPAPGLPIRVHAIPFKGASASAKTSLHLVVEVDGRDLTFTSKDSRFVESLDVAMLTVDAGGHAANGTQTTLALKLTPEEHARVQATGVRWQSTLDLAPGHYQLRVAARASTSARRGVAIAEIDVPDFTKQEVGMSGVTLTSLPSVLLITSGKKPPLATLTAPPTAARQFVSGDRITAVVQVYPDAPRQDGLRVTARLEPLGDAPRGKPLEATQPVNLATSDSRAEAGFTFGTDAMPPGPYLLTLRVHAPDGATTLAERGVSFTIVQK